MAAAVTGARAQSLAAAYPDQWVIIEVTGDELISKTGKNTAKMSAIIAELHVMMQEMLLMDKWNKEYNDYLKDTKGIAGHIRAATTLYSQGAVLLENLYLLQRAVKSNPEGIAASVPMNNLYMETAAEVVRAYRTLKYIILGEEAEDEQTEPTPVHQVPYEPGCVQVTVTIQNKSGKDIAFDGKINFILHGYIAQEDYTGHAAFHGVCLGGDYNIPAGGSKTYTVIFIKDDNPTYGLGLPFAEEGHTGSRMSNNAYYIGNKGYTCEFISSDEIFREGGSYTMTIPKGTCEWYSGGGGKSMLTGAERLDLLWNLAMNIRELNKKLRKTAISIAYYDLIDVWNHATAGMYEKDHKQIADDCYRDWQKAYKVSTLFE